MGKGKPIIQCKSFFSSEKSFKQFNQIVNKNQFISNLMGKHQEGMGLKWIKTLEMVILADKSN